MQIDAGKPALVILLDDEGSPRSKTVHLAIETQFGECPESVRETCTQPCEGVVCYTPLCGVLKRPCYEGACVEVLPTFSPGLRACMSCHRAHLAALRKRKA